MVLVKSHKSLDLYINNNGLTVLLPWYNHEPPLCRFYTAGYNKHDTQCKEVSKSQASSQISSNLRGRVFK